MKPAWRTWLGAGLLTPVLALGCSHAPKRCDTCGGGSCAPAAPPPAASPTKPAAPASPPVVINGRQPDVAGNQSPSTYGLVKPTAPATPRVLPQIVNMNPPAPPPTPAPAAPPPAAEDGGAQEQPMPSTSLKTPEPAPRPAMDLPTRTGLSHSADYTILVGELHYNAHQGTWRLRFAGLDEEDRYGGSVTLDGVGRQMDGFHDGQRVRVEGVLADPESRGVSPSYRVRDLRPLDP